MVAYCLGVAEGVGVGGTAVAVVVGLFVVVGSGVCVEAGGIGDWIASRMEIGVDGGVGELSIVNNELSIVNVGRGVADGAVWQPISRKIATKQSQYLPNTHRIIDANHTRICKISSNAASPGDKSPV
jgi:hypothetical protein